MVCFAVSLVGYCGTIKAIPLVAEKLVPKLFGVDIGKRGLCGPHDGERVPESLGLVSGTVFMLCVGVLQFVFAKGSDQVLEYNTALLSVCFAILLGLSDDIMDIRWKHKLFLGGFAALPLLLAYDGETSIVLPKFLGNYLSKDVIEGSHLGVWLQMELSVSGTLLNLGLLYYVFMFSVVVFSTNALNIYAGINGLEVGQAFVTGCSICVVNLLELSWRGGSAEEVLSGAGRNHLFSFMIMLPFISTSLALLQFNFYPARVFVGDTYPYYAGMCLATAAVLGHFVKSFVLLMIPQILNFLYSAPQLFGLVPNPRHRLPTINLKTGYLIPSSVGPRDNRKNMTLLCGFLRIFGPMHERTLCIVLLLFQGK